MRNHAAPYSLFTEQIRHTKSKNTGNNMLCIELISINYPIKRKMLSSIRQGRFQFVSVFLYYFNISHTIEAIFSDLHIIISNLSFTHYPIHPLSFSYPNFMVAHSVVVAQAKPACKHTIATRKCNQYNTIREPQQTPHLQ